MPKKTLTVNIIEGIHTRIAASIVLKASELKSKYNINLFIKKSNSSSDPFAISMLALLSLKIQKGETIEISCNNDSDIGYQAVNEMFNFINFELNSDNTMSKLDAIIEENTIANEQIINNIPIGIIVIDSNCHIVKINQYALNLIYSSEKKVYGKYIKDIIPTSELPSVVENKSHQIGQIQHINDNITITNSAPILGKNNEILGAISIFQDISEVIGIEELNEKFIKILEASHDLICFVDEYRKISYLNPAYEKHFNINKNFILGADLIDISPNGLRIKVFNTKKKLEKFFHKKDNQEVVSTIEPIFIDDKFKGIISISKPINEMKELVSKLERSEVTNSYEISINI